MGWIECHGGDHSKQSNFRFYTLNASGVYLDPLVSSTLQKRCFSTFSCFWGGIPQCLGTGKMLENMYIYKYIYIYTFNLYTCMYINIKWSSAFIVLVSFSNMPSQEIRWFWEPPGKTPWMSSMWDFTKLLLELTQFWPDQPTFPMNFRMPSLAKLNTIHLPHNGHRSSWQTSHVLPHLGSPTSWPSSHHLTDWTCIPSENDTMICRLCKNNTHHVFNACWAVIWVYLNHWFKQLTRIVEVCPMVIRKAVHVCI